MKTNQFLSGLHLLLFPPWSASINEECVACGDKVLLSEETVCGGVLGGRRGRQREAKGGRRLLLGGMVRRGVHRGCSEGGRNKNEGVAGTFFYTARASREAD